MEVSNFKKQPYMSLSNLTPELMIPLYFLTDWATHQVVSY